MQLTKLEVFGFKSFAQKATLKFDSGLIGIIGPNGCGKSNVVDSIRWVLGEQRPRILRCDRMENLIFGGTETRKPLSLAEVSLYIENNRNILPSEYTELKLTRRLHRSGDSEYLINNENVRLVDIVNLFADTGMGADAYSVIELKMVEQILSDKAEERRRLFEEAAGIKKYKARRRSALLKLDTTQQELTRLEDIIAEVQKTVNSLSRQVGKARRYHEYKKKIYEDELLLNCLKINSYRNDLAPLKNESEHVTRTRDTLSKEVRVAEAELEKMQTSSIDTEQAYRNASALLFQKDEMIKEMQNRRQLRQQRINSLKEATKGYMQEVETQKIRISQLQSEQGQLKGQLATNSKEMEAAQSQYREFANKQLEIETSHENIRSEYQTFVAENLQDLQRTNESKEEYQKIGLEKENLQEQITRNNDRSRNLSADLKSHRDDLAGIESSVKELEGDLEMYQQEQAAATSKIEALRETQESLKNEININEGKLEKARNRFDFLENLIRNYEGFSESVQYVMSNKKKFGGVVDTLANLVDCEVEYRPALESFLSEVSNYIVVEEVDTAKDILKNLRSEEKGRMTLVPLPLLENAGASNGVKLPDSGNDVFLLHDVVSYPKTYEKLFGYLFDKVYYVPDLETAIKLRKSYPHVTYITSSGEILEHWGNLTGGTSNSNGQGLIGRKEEFRKVETRLKKLEETLAEQKESLAANLSEVEEKEQKLKEFSELLDSTREEMVALDKQVSQKRYEVKRLEETAEEIEVASSSLKERILVLEAREKELLPEVQSLAEKTERYKQHEQELQSRQQQVEDQLRELTRATQEKQISYLNLTSQEKEKIQRLEFVETNIKEAQSFIDDREKRMVQNDHQVKELEDEISKINADLERDFKDRDKAEENKNTVEKRVQEIRSSIQMSEEELKKKQRLWNQARERLQEIELHAKELEVRLGAIVESVREQYGEEALKFDIADLDPSVSINSLQSELEATRRKLENLGDVNPLAVKEYDKEKERLDFLNEQHADLISARDQLLETIDKLNKTARQQFLEIFEKIQYNFERVFAQFFAGGRARLTLIESRDPLEANIDISIYHKGKELKTLTLLSAGEKTLTAISLLFAIYLVKPSPFCILDEVDAPLDDVNIGRFTHALSQFADETQFILVTHNKKTMEATNSIYGVTMEERGVSKVVSVKFD